jgi:phosphate transport system permease protein
MIEAKMALAETTTSVTTDRAASASLRRKRYASDLRLRIYGIAAISLAIGMLAVLLGTLIVGGAQAFVQTSIRMTFPISAEWVKAEDPAAGNWRNVIRDGMAAVFPDLSTAEQRELVKVLTHNAQFFVRNAVIANPSVIGNSITLEIPAADPYDQLNKGVISRDTPAENRRLTDQEIQWFDTLVERGLVTKPINWGLIFNSNSRFPELAGLKGAIVGSFYALLVCFLVSFPIGIGAAVYLEEFAPKNRWTAIIEVNINNLAAVPSIIFGLLGLALLIQTFGLPRSAPIVGGLVLALMTLPTIIIVTRNALKSVPPSIREAAFGMGASKHQMIMHHVLPLALPGILTGTIIGLAHALGETAPLLLIGMNAFITSEPGGVLDAATALPTQIYIWADSPERGFVARTSAGILVLLAFLVIMNGVAIFLRQRLERRW